MKRFAQFQLAGPVVIFTAVLAAEVAALALAYHPSSSWLWYLNLRVFGLFEQSHYVLDGATGIPAFGLFFIALPILGLACAGVAFKKHFVQALATHFSFAYAIFLFCAWAMTHPRTAGPSIQASLTLIPIPTGPNLVILGVLVGASLLSAWLSHVIYIRTRRET
jgi:hypothetical protein